MRQPPADVRARILAEMERAPSPTRAAHARTRVLAAVAAFAAVAALFVATGGVHAGDRSAALTWGVAGGWTALLALVAAAIRSRARSMLGPPTAVLAAAALGFGPALLAWFVLVHDVIAPPALPDASVPASVHVACFVFTTMLALGPVVALAVVFRGSDPVHPRALGATLGALGGGVGSVVIDLHCAVAERGHVAFAHVVPVLVLAGIGAAVGRRVFGVRG